ncbi:MAG TPA: TonB-dependent receptor [Micropepsaceae bacterium]|jgi:iron complex outermembrane receptor protein|nr:TonB-dependent receptor [Micropepsaceae bacterium]
MIASFQPLSAAAQTIDYGALEQLFGQAVTTSATGSPEHESDVPVAMEIVTADEIRRSGARDLPGVLKHVLGVDVMRWNSDSADIGIRGYDQAFSPRVLVLIDGRQVYADHYGYTPWAALPVELGAIRQIEIVKGPNAALFGFNAVNGVINIITYNPLYDGVNTASVTGGTQGLGEASAVKTFRFNGGGVRLSAGGTIDNDYSTPIPPPGNSLLSRLRNDRFAADIDGVFQITPDVQLGIEANHSTAATNDMGAIYTPAQDHHYTTSIKGQLTADTGLGLIQATAYQNWISQHYFDAADPQLVFRGEETVAQLQDLFKIGANNVFRATLEYRHDSVDTTSFVGGKVFYTDYAASGMWKWDIGSSLSLTSALRWENLHLGRSGAAPAGYPFVNDDWNRIIMELSYSTGIVWKSTDVDTLRFMFSQGDQLPSLADFGAALIVSPLVKYSGNPNADSTDVYNYEASWDRSLPSMDAKFRASIFYQAGQDFLAFQGATIPNSGSSPFGTGANIGDSSARGIELSLSNASQQGWRWALDYRYESITDRFEPFAAGGTDFVDFQHVTPKHIAHANLGWSGGHWEIDGYLYYQSPTHGLLPLPVLTASFLTPIPDYLSFDARIAYRLTDWATLAVSGQNLGSSPQKQTSGPAVERSVFATLTVNF